MLRDLIGGVWGWLGCVNVLFGCSCGLKDDLV
jgi:hypothetical protein